MELLSWALSCQRCFTHLSKSEGFLRMLSLSWRFGSLSLPVAVHFCIHGQSWSGKLGEGSAQVWGTTVKFFTLLKLSSLDEVLLTEERGCKMPEFSPGTGDKHYFFILWVFHLSCLSFLKRKVVGMWSLSSFWYSEGQTVHFFWKSDKISWPPKIRIILFPGVFPWLSPRKELEHK